MQSLLTKIFIKKGLGGFQDKYAKPKPTNQPYKQTDRQTTGESHSNLHEGSGWGRGLSSGWPGATSWQAVCAQGPAQTLENPHSLGQRLLQSCLSLSTWGDSLRSPGCGHFQMSFGTGLG